jgi:hypothetical protein
MPSLIRSKKPLAFRVLAAAGAVGTLSLASCGRQPTGLVGNWSAQALPKSMLQEDASPLDSPNAQEKSADGGETPTMELRFYRNGRLDTVTRLPQIQTHKSGTWRLIHSDPPQRRITIECELLGQTTEHVIEWIDDDTIRLIPPNMAGLKLELDFKRSR